MAKKKQQAEETPAERRERIEAEERHNKHVIAHRVSPQAGEELDVNSDAYKQLQKDRKA
jgi:hypothetical protein